MISMANSFIYSLYGLLSIALYGQAKEQIIVSRIVIFDGNPVIYLPIAILKE